MSVSDAGLPATRAQEGSLQDSSRSEGGYNLHLMEKPTGNAIEHIRVHWRDWIRVLVKRRWALIGAFLGATTLALFGSLLMPSRYTAVVTIQLDPNTVRVVESGNVNPNEYSSNQDFFQTQYELLKSRTLAQRVVARLGLASDANFMGRASGFSALLGRLLGSRSTGNGPDAPSVASTEKAAISTVMANTYVEPVRASRLVLLRYVGQTPASASLIANALSEGFVSSNLDRKVESSSYAKTFLEDQLQEMKLKLEESDRTLLNFAQKEQIVALGDRASLMETNLGTANQSLSAAVGQRIRAEQVWKQAESTSGMGLPQFLDSNVIQQLRSKRVDLASDYKEKLNLFKPDYPEMVKTKAKMDEIDRQIAAETSVIKASLKSAYVAARSQEDTAQAQLEALKAENLDLQQRSIQYNILKREADTNRSIYDGLLQRYKEVGIAGAVGANNVSIVDRAEPPGSPSSPRVLLNTVIGGILGLVVGVGLALVREYVDDTLKSGEDVERVARLPVLGVVPKGESISGFAENLADPRSAISEAYRSLVTTLQFSSSSGVPNTLLITSSKPSEGKSTTALALAKNFAAIGNKVVLVDCDLRKPSLHRALGIDNSVGLTNYLTGASSLDDLIQTTVTENLYFLPTGPLPPNPAELLAGARLQTFLSLVSEHFDLVILDGPPVMGLADSPLLGNAAQGTLVVVAAGETRAVALKAAMKRLQFTRTALVGAVVSKFDSKNVGYGYGYGYGYGDGAYEYYAYGDAPEKLQPAAGTAALEARSKS